MHDDLIVRKDFFYLPHSITEGTLEYDIFANNGKCYIRQDVFSDGWVCSFIKDELNDVCLEISDHAPFHMKYSFVKLSANERIGHTTYFDVHGDLRLDEKYITSENTEWKQYSNGALVEEGQSYNQAYHGNVVAYYHDGSIHEICNYDKGSLCGEQKGYSIKGDLVHHWFYLTPYMYVDLLGQDEKIPLLLTMNGCRVPPSLEHLVKTHAYAPYKSLP